MRYQFSGVNSTILDATVDATGVDAGDPTALLGGQWAIGRANTTGRVLWLRWLSVHNDGPTGQAVAVTLQLFDATAGTNPTSATRRQFVRCASSPGAATAAMSGGQTTRIEWPAPGLKFTTGICISKCTTDASGSFQQGQIGGGGYEE